MLVPTGENGHHRKERPQDRGWREAGSYDAALRSGATISDNAFERLSLIWLDFVSKALVPLQKPVPYHFDWDWKWILHLLWTGTSLLNYEYESALSPSELYERTLATHRPKSKRWTERGAKTFALRFHQQSRAKHKSQLRRTWRLTLGHPVLCSLPGVIFSGRSPFLSVRLSFISHSLSLFQLLEQQTQIFGKSLQDSRAHLKEEKWENYLAHNVQ